MRRKVASNIRHGFSRGVSIAIVIAVIILVLGGAYEIIGLTKSSVGSHTIITSTPTSSSSSLVIYTSTVILTSSSITGKLTSTITSTSQERSSSSLPVWSSLRGVNYFWTTVQDPNKPQETAPPPWVSFPQIRANGWNLLRVQLHWNEYVVNPSLYVSNMQTIAWYAEQNGLYVIWDLIHQAGTSSQYTVEGEQGVGFPTFLTAPYSTPQSFWTAWWANQTSYEGESGWSLALQYDTLIVKGVDNYSSTLGYEILNEPPIFSSNGMTNMSAYDFAGMQAFNTYVSSNLRTLTSKIIIYDRSYMHPDILSTCIGVVPSCLSIVAPRKVSNIALDYHQYNTYNSTLLGEIQSFSTHNHVPVFLGEYAPCSRTNTTCPTSETLVGQYIYDLMSTAHSDGWAWTYWSWREGTSGPPWQDLLNNTGGEWWLDREIVSVQTQVYGS